MGRPGGCCSTVSTTARARCRGTASCRTRVSLRRDLLRGLGVAASAVVISSVAANGDLGSSGRALSIGVVGTAAIAGVTAFLSTRRERAVPANIEENKQRRATRDVANTAIARRNAEKVAQTTLVIEPAGGVGP